MSAIKQFVDTFCSIEKNIKCSNKGKIVDNFLHRGHNMN